MAMKFLERYLQECKTLLAFLLAVIVILTFVWLITLVNLARPEFGYHFMSNNTEITITEYRWNRSEIQIPSHIHSLPVTAIAESVFVSSNRQGIRRGPITSVTIPDGVTHIGRGAFLMNRITYLSIPNSITTIGSSAFADNQLTYVTIPSNLTEIEAGVFRTNHLTSITISYGVTSIGQRAFYRNRLTSVTIPYGVTSIGERAFFSNRLTSITIPDSVTYIGRGAFRNNQLTYVTIPYHTTLDENAFDSGVTVIRKNFDH